ncbi:MAG: trimeric intracellular cation channel family protein, partial [Verrucomicrobiaceae bacterium]|nr:trimeric intracellular cation channel family protein [Verrucomicrobiaceae bacterium]
MLSGLIGDTPPTLLHSPDYLLIAIAATVFSFVGAPRRHRFHRCISLVAALR